MRDLTIEDYCRSIRKLDSGKGARSVDLARQLTLSKITVAVTLAKLQRVGYVLKEKYGRVHLTEKGKDVARHMDFRHRVMEFFLHRTLGMPLGKVHAEAQRAEHVFSDDAIRRLYHHLGRPKRDPHGRDIVLV